MIFFTEDETALLAPEKESERSDAFARRLAERGEELYLFGAGMAGKSILPTLTEAGVAVAGYLDNNSSLWGKTVCGKPVYPPERPAGKPYVVIAMRYLWHISAAIADCRRLGYDYILLDAFMIDYGRSPFRARLELIESKAAPLYRSGVWADALSEDIYHSVVRHKALGDDPVISGLEYDRDFESFVSEGCYRSFVSLANFIDDSYFRYLLRFEGNFDSYTTILSGEKDNAVMRQVAERHPGTRCEAVREYTTEAVLETLERVAGDAVPGFVKVELSDSTLPFIDAIGGYLRKYRPALAVHVSYNDYVGIYPPADMDLLFKVPGRLRDLDAGYRLYLRQYGDGIRSSRAICYAVPGE